MYLYAHIETRSFSHPRIHIHTLTIFFFFCRVTHKIASVLFSDQRTIAGSSKEMAEVFFFFSFLVWVLFLSSFILV